MSHKIERNKTTRTRITWDPSLEVYHAVSSDDEIKPVLRQLANKFGVIYSEEAGVLRGTYPKAAALGDWDQEAMARIEFGLAFADRDKSPHLQYPTRVGPILEMPGVIREPSAAQTVSDTIPVQPRRDN